MFRRITRKIRGQSNRVVPVSTAETTTTAGLSTTTTSGCDEDGRDGCCSSWLKRRCRKVIPFVVEEGLAGQSTSGRVKDATVASGSRGSQLPGGEIQPILKYSLKLSPAQTDLLSPPQPVIAAVEEEEEELATQAVPVDEARSTTGPRVCWADKDEFKSIPARDKAKPPPQTQEIRPKSPPQLRQRSKREEADVVDCCCWCLGPLKRFFR